MSAQIVMLLAVLAFGFGLGFRFGEWARQRRIDNSDDKPMKRKRAQKRLRQIWRDEHPGCMSIEEAFHTPEPWKWFNVYANLQNHNPTLQAAVEAFAESHERRAKQKRHLEEIIVQQRAELKKRCAELERIKRPAATTTTGAPCGSGHKPQP